MKNCFLHFIPLFVLCGFAFCAPGFVSIYGSSQPSFQARSSKFPRPHGLFYFTANGFFSPSFVIQSCLLSTTVLAVPGMMDERVGWCILGLKLDVLGVRGVQLVCATCVWGAWLGVGKIVDE